jgi:4,5-DOPA dioxygenase extradiol
MDDLPENGLTMPAVFIGHGSPMNAVEDNPFSLEWVSIGKTLPRPDAILCISAHWETMGTHVTAAENPVTIHDFWGFPETLNSMNYPATGQPHLAELLRHNIQGSVVNLDKHRGLDHGAWSVLHRMFPKADIPVVQLSLDTRRGLEFHYRLGKELGFLRKRGILILGSGNLVHNPGLITLQDAPFEWAARVDALLSKRILEGAHDDLMKVEQLDPGTKLAIPTYEHYLPLLYILAVQNPKEKVQFFREGFTFGSISMRSLVVGGL